MSARRLAIDQALLELTAAANVAVRALPRRERNARYRLEAAVQRVVIVAGASHPAKPSTPHEAFEQLAAALRAAKAAGVPWQDVVCLVNGDNER